MISVGSLGSTVNILFRGGYLEWDLLLKVDFTQLQMLIVSFGVLTF